MDSKRSARVLFACVCLSPLGMGINCASFVPADDAGNDGGNTLELTTAEGQALLGALRAAGGITQASGISHTAATAQQDSAALSPAGLTFGTCPEVTFDSTLGNAALDVLIDFGSGCTLSASPAFACSGSAEGRLDAVGRTIDLTFNSIGCTDDRSLSGEVSMVYDTTSFEVSLDGQWDLTYTVKDSTLQSTGDGSVVYDADEQVTTITQYQGHASQNGNQWDVTIDSLKISFIHYGSFMPFAGTITVTGSAVRNLTIRCNADSPSTGDVEISINGSDFFTVNLSSLGS